LLVLIGGTFMGSFDSIWDLHDAISSRVGVMQAALQPSFPAWKHNISIPRRVFREGVHTFRVSLGRMWFRIAMPAADNLESLASAILRAVHFDSDHLYNFKYRNRFGVLEEVNHPYMEDGPWTAKSRSANWRSPSGSP
jgi:hypothetical protein